MIGKIKTGTLKESVISAVIHEGFTVSANGKRCRLAIIDDTGKIVESGEAVEREAFNVAIDSYKALLKGMGHIRVVSGDTAKAA